MSWAALNRESATWERGRGRISKDCELPEGKAMSHFTSYSELLSCLQLRRSFIKCVEGIKKHK